jgi:hypothetical protein
VPRQSSHCGTFAVETDAFAFNDVKKQIRRSPQMTDWTDEETDDRHNFYKVEKWSRDGLRVELMLYGSNNLDKARRIFERTTKHRPGIRLTIRQRMRVLDEWPRHETML